MIYIKYRYENGYPACSEEGVAAYDDGTDIDEIESDLSDGLFEFGTEYEYCADGYSFEDGWENEETQNEYYENLYFYWEEITQEEYDNFNE